MAKKLGHTVTNIKPSLVPLSANLNENIEQDFIKKIDKTSLNLCKELQGLSLKNVEIKLFDIENKKIIYQDFGEMLFTHFGISGPIILSSSAHLLRYKKVDELLKKGKIMLKIDLKPALSEEKLNINIIHNIISINLINLTIKSPSKLVFFHLYFLLFCCLLLVKINYSNNYLY